MTTNSEVEEILKGMVIQPITKKYFNPLFELVAEAYKKEIEITGGSVLRFYRIAKLFRLVQMFHPVFDIFHKDYETVLVAVSGDKLIGYSHIFPLGKRIWHIVTTAVDEKYRGRGIFKKLLKADLRYISKRNGERAFTYIPLYLEKACKELKFDILAKETQFLVELDRIPTVGFSEGVSIREATSADIERIYQIYKAVSPKKARAFKIGPEDFRDSFLNRIRTEISWSYSKKWVIEMEGEIVGYVHFIYSPIQQTGEIPSFYVLPSSKSSKLTSLLLSEVLKFLTNRNIRKVTVFIDDGWKETMEIFERFGFKPITPNYVLVNELV